MAKKNPEARKSIHAKLLIIGTKHVFHLIFPLVAKNIFIGSLLLRYSSSCFEMPAAGFWEEIHS